MNPDQALVRSLMRTLIVQRDILDDIKLTPGQMDLVTYIDHNPRRTSHQIAHRLNISHESASTKLYELVKKGWLERGSAGHAQPVFVYRVTFR